MREAAAGNEIPKYRKKRKGKPFAIECKSFFGKWLVHGRYATEQDMRKALAALQGTTYFGCKFEYRVKGEANVNTNYRSE